MRRIEGFFTRKLMNAWRRGGRLASGRLASPGPFEEAGAIKDQAVANS
jgi:hypothetical protein